MSQKVIYASKTIDSVINGFIPHELRINLHICDQPIVKFGIRGLCLGFSSTFHIDSLYRFRRPVVDKVKTEVWIEK